MTNHRANWLDTRARGHLGCRCYAASVTIPQGNVPDATIALALGYCAGRPHDRQKAGQVLTLCNELRRRGVYEGILAALNPALRDRVRLLERMDRGAAWADRGKRPARVDEITEIVGEVTGPGMD